MSETKQNKYFGNMFASSRINKDTGEREVVEGEFYICTTQDLNIPAGTYINLRTPERHYNGLIQAGKLTPEKGTEELQKAKAKNVRLIPQIGTQAKLEKTSGF